MSEVKNQTLVSNALKCRSASPCPAATNRPSAGLSIQDLSREQALHRNPVAEKALMELALAAWRSTNSAGRKSMRAHLESIVKASP